MSWTSVGLIPTTDGWQYTQPFVGDYIRVRHSLGVNQDDLPYGFTGLIAQAFDFGHTVELFEIRKLYPLNQEDILAVINPFPGRSRRLAVKGQQRYQTGISWQVVIHVWQGAVNAPASPDYTNVNLCDRFEELEEKIDDLVNSNNAINTLLNLILNNLGIPTPTIEAGVDNSIFSVEGLVGQWDLSNSFADSSPDGTDNNSASLSGSASFVPSADFGHVLRLKGDGYLSIPNTEDINLGNHSKRTINVWFKADSTQPRQVIFEEGGIVRGLNIYLNQNTLYFGGWNEPDDESGWKGTFFKTSAGNGWHLATITLDATLWTMATEPNTFKAYLDGQLVGSGDGSQLWGHADPTAFGAVNGATLFHDGAGSSGSYLIGEIAKPKIFNRVLSSTEIQNIYNNFS